MCLRCKKLVNWYFLKTIMWCYGTRFFRGGGDASRDILSITLGRRVNGQGESLKRIKQSQLFFCQDTRFCQTQRGQKTVALAILLLAKEVFFSYIILFLTII